MPAAQAASMSFAKQMACQNFDFHLVQVGATQISTGLRFGLPAEFVLALVSAYSPHARHAAD